MPVEAAPRAKGRCRIHPAAATRLAAVGLETARDFLELPGVVVSGHVGRNVSRVDLGGTVGYLKREHTVRWRDRWRNLLAGFGPASMSVREAEILTHLGANDFPSPPWLAYGEAEGQAFLLLEAASGAIDFRRFLNIDSDFAALLGRMIADLHAAGVHQPDLFAKHLLINPGTRAVTLLDWQRATRKRIVPRSDRIAALGTFRATCSHTVLPSAEWSELLRAYLEASRETNVEDFVRRVGGVADRAARRPAIRSQLAPPAVEQELIRIGGETVCSVPALGKDLDRPEVIATLYDPRNDGRQFRFSPNVVGTLRVTRYRSPVGRWVQFVRGKAWRAPELRTARLLFHLERDGIPAPQLLAYGQHVTSPTEARAFVLTGSAASKSLTAADLGAARVLLDRLHSVGCVVAPNIRSAEVFGFVRGQVVVADPSGLRLHRNPSRRRIARDHARLAALLRTAP